MILNVTPSGKPTKLWGFVGMVVPTAHTTQQNFVIGQFQTENKSDWSRHILQYLNQYPFPLTRFQPHILLSHTYPPSISHFLCKSLSLCYQSYTTMGKKCPQIQTHFIHGSQEISV